jgi:CheY-like chemotaxis protein
MQKIFLLADDDMDDTLLFCEALETVDDTVICYCATHGQEALDILAKEKLPHLIFLDINMPRMNGWECLKRIRENTAYKNIPILVYSTSSHQNDINTALDLGALCFFSKPNNFDDLKNILEVIVNHVDKDLLPAISRFNGITSQKVFSCSDE